MRDACSLATPSGDELDLLVVIRAALSVAASGHTLPVVLGDGGCEAIHELRARLGGLLGRPHRRR